MEQKNYTRESIYRILLHRLLRAAKRNAEAKPDNEYYANAVEALGMLAEGIGVQ